MSYIKRKYNGGKLLGQLIRNRPQITYIYYLNVIKNKFHDEVFLYQNYYFF